MLIFFSMFCFSEEMTLNPAMLVYLNRNKNTVGAPNENYTRELQELFAIGKGRGSFYAESEYVEGVYFALMNNWNRNYVKSLLIVK